MSFRPPIDWTIGPATGQIQYINDSGVEPLDILILDNELGGFRSGSR